LKEKYHEILLANDWNVNDLVMCKLDHNTKKEFCEYFFKDEGVKIIHPDGEVEHFKFA
jgi:hypothetical protein